MKRAQWLALLLGILLVTAPLIRADEEEYDDGDDDDEEAASTGEDKDVVVITAANFEEKVKKSKFALVGLGSRHAQGGVVWLAGRTPGASPAAGARQPGASARLDGRRPQRRRSGPASAATDLRALRALCASCGRRSTHTRPSHHQGARN